MADLSKALEAAAAGAVARRYGASPERAREIAENVAAGRDLFDKPPPSDHGPWPCECDTCLAYGEPPRGSR